MVKIVDLLQTKKNTFSFEVTPNITESDLDSLEVEPTFYSVTWHAKSHQNKDLDIPPIKLAKLIRSRNKDVLLHLSCDLLKRNYLTGLLTELQEHDICNLLIVLGGKYTLET
jgi:5,10-methylenetetrahydrofolate reductase